MKDFVFEPSSFPERTCETAGTSLGYSSRSATGIFAGTTVLTQNGWQDAETIRPGDYLETFEDGWRSVIDVQTGKFARSSLDCPKAQWPFYVPTNVLGNEEPVLLSPDQNVVFECDVVEDMTGDPFILMPIRALAGFKGITLAEPPEDLTSVEIHFSRPALIGVGFGAFVSCSSRSHLEDLLAPALPAVCRQVLTLPKARELVFYLAKFDRLGLSFAKAG